MTALSLLYFLIIITVIIGLHEFGHYSVARFFKVAVKEFSIGFGPSLYKRQDKNGTFWNFRAFPLGGFVEMCNDENAKTTYEKESNSILSGNPYKSIDRWKRILIIAAGPLINIILAILIFTGINFALKTPTTPAVIGKVIENSAAEKAGLLAGDKLVSINGKQIYYFQDFIIQTSALLEEKTTIEVIRDGEITPRTFTVNPDIIETQQDKRLVKKAIYGIQSPPMIYENLPIDQAFTQAFSMTTGMIKGNIIFLKDLIVGNRSTESLRGLIGIAETTDTVHKESSQKFKTLLFLAAVISIGIAVFNFIPLPSLDGGQIVLLIIESITQKEIPEPIVRNINTTGYLILIGLFAFTTVQDIYYLF